MALEKIAIRTTTRSELIDITEEVQGVVTGSGIDYGIVLVYSPHTTAAITVNENADPAVQSDMVMKTGKLIARDDPDYRHGEGNSDGHVKSTLFGASETFIIESGRVVLGRWQGIYFCEFDGPRTREVLVKVLKG